MKVSPRGHTFKEMTVTTTSMKRVSPGHVDDSDNDGYDNNNDDDKRAMVHLKSDNVAATQF